ncbi:MAG: hypothetical protein HC860_12065, partial [Alkalinema sp. RU_4_3]|nr:hypothetical protein [Alkalinema sp. RU_4_3]
MNEVVMVELNRQKAELLRHLAQFDRGLNPLDQGTLDQILTLEAQTPNPRPVEAIDLLVGDWRLVYTNSQGILGLDRFPLFQLGTVYQSIRAEGLRLYNVAEIQGLPLLSGIGAVYHANPLDGKTIGKLVASHGATILISTPTFCQTYLRTCEPAQLATVRHALVGAERLPPRSLLPSRRSSASPCSKAMGAPRWGRSLPSTAPTWSTAPSNRPATSRAPSAIP